ncbi:helix-turn-helix domain-containing protein [Planococcus ruber]|uniref:helix-turn-helix domain-containing protein n=1 Tax=Planococcus ruber TaxID=2027871 RepID=UPI001FEFD215|nr:helix-turn-helix domain-containing protein [Planococcus ruber]MCJ1907495.1 helix-turn-helix domain-containing protein [Planococcus ruber]
MPEIKKGIGELLQKKWNERNYTLRHFAELTGVDKATISRILNGKRKPTLDHLKVFAQVLEMPLSDLIAAESTAVDLPKAAKRSASEEGEEKAATAEMRHMLALVKMQDERITMDRIAAELDGCSLFAETEEGHEMLKESFSSKVKHFGNAGRYLQLLKKWKQHYDQANGTKKELAIMGGALLYFIMPLDLLHDYLFAIGYLDDCLAIQLANSRLESKIG